jgi:hypothetical protein
MRTRGGKVLAGEIVFMASLGSWSEMRRCNYFHSSKLANTFTTRKAVEQEALPAYTEHFS